MSNLLAMSCTPRSGAALNRADAVRLLGQTPGWALDENSKAITRTWRFGNYYETIAFVNALAWIAHREDHHPDLAVGYNHCQVRFSTHSVNGLSENDFICAAKINTLHASGP